MKKIIHLSDLHIGHKDCGEKLRAIIDNISQLMQPAKNYIIVITGDIVNNANRSSQIGEAVGAIRLLEKRGYRVLAIPGNHDYGNGAKGNKKFVELFKEKFYNSREITYPKLDIIGKLAFIGLDSTAEELHWNDRFFSEGELGIGQLKRLKEILKDPKIVDCKKVVYLHHHPFDFKLAMQLKDSDELRKIIQNKVDALLFGHYHKDSSSPVKMYHGTWGIPRCYNGGSSTHKNGDPGFQRIMDLSGTDPGNDYDGNFV
ncbi:MAG: metallophosphoesterase [Bacteroidota bacterium]